jgi:Mg2+/citrate symporter
MLTPPPGASVTIFPHTRYAKPVAVSTATARILPAHAAATFHVTPVGVVPVKLATVLVPRHAAYAMPVVGSTTAPYGVEQVESVVTAPVPKDATAMRDAPLHDG